MASVPQIENILDATGMRFLNNHSFWHISKNSTHPSLLPEIFVKFTVMNFESSYHARIYHQQTTDAYIHPLKKALIEALHARKTDEIFKRDGYLVGLDFQTVDILCDLITSFIRPKVRGATLEGLHGSALCARYNPVSESLYTSACHDKTISVWQNVYCSTPNKNTHINMRFKTKLEGHTSWVWCLVYDAETETLYSGSQDQTIKVWQYKTIDKTNTDTNTTIKERVTDAKSELQCIATLRGHTAAVRCLSYDSESMTLYSGSDDSVIKVWKKRNFINSYNEENDVNNTVDDDSTNIICVMTLEGHDCSVYALIYDSSSGTLYSGSFDCTIKVWEKPSHHHHQKICYHSDCRPIRKSNNVNDVNNNNNNNNNNRSGRRNNEEDDDNDPNVEFICVNTLKGHEADVRCLLYDASTMTLFSGSEDQTIKMWQKKNDESHSDGARSSSSYPICIGTFRGHSGSVQCMSYDSTRRVLYSGSNDKTIQVWQRTSTGLNCLYILDGHQGPLRTLVYDTKTRTLFSGSHDKTIKSWQFLE
jgi:WD40 repeat protein